MSARILNHVSHPPTQAEFATHQMHTSSTVKLYEAIVLAISRTIDACSDFEQPQYQTRPDTSLEKGDFMVTLFAPVIGMYLLDHLNGVLYEKLLLFFSLGLPRFAGPKACSTCYVGCLERCQGLLRMR